MAHLNEVGIQLYVSHKAAKSMINFTSKICKDL